MYVTLYRFKVYNVLVWYSHVWKHDYQPASTSIVSHTHHFLFVVRTFKISLGNLQVYDTVLLFIITRLLIRSPELTHLLTGRLCPLTNICPWHPYPLTPGYPQSLVTSLLLCVSLSLAFVDFTRKWYYTVLVSVWLTSLSIMPSRSNHVVTNGCISFFLVAE